MYHIKIHFFINFLKLSVLPIYIEALQTKRGKHTLREFMLKKADFPCTKESSAGYIIECNSRTFIPTIYNLTNPQNIPEPELKVHPLTEHYR
jgi:hypothetical protein